MFFSNEISMYFLSLTEFIVTHSLFHSDDKTAIETVSPKNGILDEVFCIKVVFLNKKCSGFSIEIERLLL